MATRIQTSDLPTAMGHHLPVFDDVKDKWQSYLVKVEAYFEANQVTDDAKKRALLVAALETRTIDILCGQVAPQKPNSLSYQSVVNELNKYYDPTPNEISESFKFFHRQQHEGEPVQDFIVEIRRIAQNCNFATMLDRMLRDRIVCGVRSKNLQKQLLAKKDLTLAEATALAIAAEHAELDSQKISTEAGSTDLLALKVPRRWRAKRNASDKQCERCGNSGHDSAACSMRHRRCYSCGTQGHLARMCRKEKKTIGERHSAGRQR